MMRLATTNCAACGRMKRPKFVWLTAAALSSTLTGSNAFLLPRNQHALPGNLAVADSACRRLPSNVRLLAKRRSSGVLGKVKSVAKSLLPNKWFKSEEERRQAEQRKLLRNEMKGSMKAILKDAPLPIRALASVVAPLVSTALSGLAEGMADQQRQVADQLEQARSLIAADASAVAALGEGIQIGAPLSQSSSSSSINGKMSSRIDLSFPVAGSNSSGTARLSSINGSIQSLQLQTNRGTLSINTSRKASSRSQSSRRMKSDLDDIIEAEIVEDKRPKQ